MSAQYIPFKSTGFFSKLICDYLDEHNNLRSFYTNFPNIENFKNQIDLKIKNYPNENRIHLLKVLKEQYQHTTPSTATKTNIESLADNRTFTITTGHQLNLFSGPLYFFYKIISTLNLAKTLKHKYPHYNFVPIYWMATEDHDFDEIKFFNFKEKKIVWNTPQTGAVGRFKTEGLETVLKIINSEFGESKNAKTLKSLFENAYLQQPNLASATRYLVNQLFGAYGLVILDADHRTLKQMFSPFVKKELFENCSYNAVAKTNKMLEHLGYKTQVNPRAINLFYIKDDKRERIVFQDNSYNVLHTNIRWNKTDIAIEVETHPERFSPNVLTRPLYEEVILPNLCYIGGGGEIAYWLQLKESFEIQNITFPILLLRNSVLIQSKKQQKKIERLGLSNKDLFLKQDNFLAHYIKTISTIDIDFSEAIEHLKQQFQQLYNLAAQTDASFLGAVNAQETKQINGLKYLEKRLLNAQKRKLKTQVKQAIAIQDLLFPHQKLQERHLNFSELYLEFGNSVIAKLINTLEPLKDEFLILKTD